MSKTIDRIVCTIGETTREMSPTEFMKIELTQRMQIILEGKALFFSGDRELPAVLALRSLYNPS